MAVAANNEKQWTILLEKIGRKDLLQDARFASNPLRVQHRDALEEIINDALLQKTNEEWQAIFDGSGLAHGPVNTIQQAFEHPQAIARNMVQETETPHAESGKIKMIGPAVKFSESQIKIRSPPPLLGEHTNDVLGELGYSKEEIDELRGEGVI